MKTRLIERIYLHTAAWPGDPSAAQIHDAHVARGWSQIGYHFVVRVDGTIETGRSVDTVGAGVQGDNARSIHVCMSGDHEAHPPSPAQYEATINKLAELCVAYLVKPFNVLGHREVNERIRDGRVAARYKTRKSCPGKHVDMADVRERVAARVSELADKI